MSAFFIRIKKGLNSIMDKNLRFNNVKISVVRKKENVGENFKKIICKEIMNIINKNLNYNEKIRYN